MLFSEGSENFTSPIVACDRMFTTGSLDFPKVTGKDRLAYIFSALELTWACFECCHHSQRFKRERERERKNQELQQIRRSSLFITNY
jgi:hypothetical protein